MIIGRAIGLTISAALLTGWFYNLYHIINIAINGSSVTMDGVISGIGIFVPPLGAVYGLVLLIG